MKWTREQKEVGGGDVKEDEERGGEGCGESKGEYKGENVKKFETFLILLKNLKLS